MKRKTLLSISVAVLLVVAMTATAFAASNSSVSVSGPGSISTGQTIEITVTGTGLGINADIDAEGLTVDKASNQFSSVNAVVLLPDFGTPSVTYTCTVTAGPGETARFALVNATAATDDDGVASISGDSWSATVPSNEPQPTDEPTQAPDGNASSAPTGTAGNGGSGSGSGSGSNTGSGSGSGNADKMPKTGDATMDLWVLAVIAAGCAGAAVVAGKKVFAK